jgi:hypothetical protein
MFGYMYPVLHGNEVSRALALGLSQHANQHRPERPILLAVGSATRRTRDSRLAPELADPVGAFEVGEHQDVEQLGARSGTERGQALPQLSFELIGPHRATACSRISRSRRATGDWTVSDSS